MQDENENQLPTAAGEAAPIQIPEEIVNLLRAISEQVIKFVDDIAAPMVMEARLRLQEAQVRVREATAPALSWLQENGPKIIEFALAMKRTTAEMAFPNWELLESEEEWLKALRLAKSNDGVPLVWVPGPAVVRDLVRAPDHEARDAVLLENAEVIQEYAQAVLADVAHPELAQLRDAIRQGWAAFGDGLFIPAQTTASSAVGQILLQSGHRTFGTFKALWAGARSSDPLAGGLVELRLTAVMCAVSTAVQDDRHVPDLRGFNRHTTAHWIQPQHYSQVNALRGLMLVTSAIRELQFTLAEEWMHPRPGPVPIVSVGRIAAASNGTPSTAKIWQVG